MILSTWVSNSVIGLIILTATGDKNLECVNINGFVQANNEIHSLLDFGVSTVQWFTHSFNKQTQIPFGVISGRVFIF